MILGKRILAVVPARGGSKGIPLKNLRLLAGIPLVGHAGRFVTKAGIFDRAVVSTDDQRIADVAKDFGLDAPFLRPPEISGDFAGDIEVLIHALGEVEHLDDKAYDVTVMLQPTSPLRRVEHVRFAVEKLIQEDWDAVWTVSETDSKVHPLKQLVMNDEGEVSLYDPSGRGIVARQQLGKLYHRNGVAYVFSRSCLHDQKTNMPKRWAAVVIPEHLINIDTEFDLEFGEWLISRSRAFAEEVRRPG